MAKRPSGADRAKRLVALIGHLHPGERISIDDLALAVGISSAQLVDDLDMLSMCGVVPYDPGDLTPIYVEDGYVEVWGEMPAISGPIRLSPAEASALSAALQAAGFEPDSPLVSRLLQASAAQQFDAAEMARTIRAAHASHDPGVFETLAEAVRTHLVVAIEYAASGAPVSCRDIEPVTLFAERDAWYLTAWCRRAQDWRTFRVDRVRSARLGDETFSEHGTAPERSPRAFDTKHLPVATIRFERGVFDARSWPGARVIATDGGTTVAEVPYAGTAWIARAVMAGLGSIEAVAPTEVREAVRDLASAELLLLRG